jgi:adenosine deaminase
MTDSAAFQAALAVGSIEDLRRVAKADLHNHGIMGGCREFLRARTGRDIAPVETPLASMAQMHAWTDAATGGLFNHAAGRLIGFEAAFVQARRDGVTRLEIGEDVWAITLNGGSAEALTGALVALHRRAAPEIEWIPLLGVSRHCSIAAIQRWMEPFLRLGVYRAIDLSGDEFAQPIEAFAPVYQRARAAGLRLKAHVGEWGSADDVRRAVEVLELDEVQHGLAAAVSPPVMRFLADHRIRLNMCPTSNLMLGRVESLAAHPIRRLYDAGVRVSVNTDDVLVFGQGVSDEFLNLHRAGLFTTAELDEIRQNGLSD